MYSNIAQTANELWLKSIQTLYNNHHIHGGSRDQQTREILHYGMTLTDPRQRLVFSHPLNPAFLAVEIVWILAGFNSVEFLKFWNPRMEKYSDDGIWFNAGYGTRLGISQQLGDHWYNSHLQFKYHNEPNQFLHAFTSLKNNPDSRQVVMLLYKPDRDSPGLGGDPQSKDIPCNISSMLLVRDGKLHWMQTQRSQDCFWGLPTNIFQWTILQEVMAGWLEMELGNYSLAVNSFHAYKRHWEEMENLIEIFNAPEPQEYTNTPLNHHDLRLPYNLFQEMFPKLLESIDMMRKKEDAHELLKTLGSYWLGDYGEGWTDIQKIICTEALRRRGFLRQSLELIEEVSDFWKVSYKQWFNKIEIEE